VAGNIIETTDLTKKYGSYTAVDQLNLSILKGEIFGLLGPNGAGKSTAILMMMGLTEPDSGSVRVCGIDPASDPIGVKKRVGYLPEDIGFYDDMTGLETLLYTARLNSIPESESRERAGKLLTLVGLEGEEGKKAGKYSRGMRQRLGLADVLIKEPEVIILDEPTLGIDPAGVREFMELIVELSREQGITVLFSSHLLHQVQQVCDRVGLFVEGRLLAHGNIQDLSQGLFSHSPYTVEAGISSIPLKDINLDNARQAIAWLKNALGKMDGIADVSFDKNKFQIECSRDLTKEIAAAIVGSGASLTSLNRKSYGLDEIYYRYFEGGNENGKQNKE
jgi:ABC-2 type transport system ATP-binding protein